MAIITIVLANVIIILIIGIADRVSFRTTKPSGGSCGRSLACLCRRPCSRAL